MVSGNYLNGMFSKNKKDKIIFDESTYKYITLLKLEEACDIIYNHFNSMQVESDFKFFENSQFTINFYYKKKNNQISLIVYKISKIKFLFIFTFKMVR